MVEVPQEWIAFAQELADAARQVIVPLFRTQLEREHKEASSPVVTLADREAERVMREMIEAKFPHHSVWGEEFGCKRGASEYLWVLDPVDGTIAFSTGKPLFGTLIGLLNGNVPQFGIIDQSISGERWLGVRGQATQYNGEMAHTSAVKTLKQAAVATTTPFMFETSWQQRLLEQLKQSAHLMSFGGDCCNYALLASGHLDVVIERDLKLHDWAALTPVIEGAGGVITDWQGKALTPEGPGEVIAAATPELHAEVVELIARCR